MRRPNSTKRKTCRVCGDALDEAHSRPNEYTGKHWPAGPVDAYISGQVILITVNVWNAHGGHIQWRLCNDTTQETDNQACFDEHLLQIVSARASNNKIIWNSTYLGITTAQGSLYVYADLTLPAGLACERYVLQFTYLGNKLASLIYNDNI